MKYFREYIKGGGGLGFEAVKNVKAARSICSIEWTLGSEYLFSRTKVAMTFRQ